MKDLGEGYKLTKNAIYCYDTRVFVKLYDLIDFSSFQRIDADSEKVHYFKDRDHVYIRGYLNNGAIIEGADPNRFEIFDAKNEISKCNETFYWWDKPLPYDYSKVERLNEFYLRSEKKIYFIKDEVMGADARNFKIIWVNLGSDLKQLYFRQNPVTEIDLKSFKILPGCFEHFHLASSHTFYCVDRQSAYFFNTLTDGFKKLKGVRPEDFSVIIKDQKLYGLSGKTFYYFGKKQKFV